MTTLWIIYAVGLIVSAALALIFSTNRHWLERASTVAMCLLWPIVAGTCVLIVISTAWDRYAYRKRGEATGDWRP